jgi:hypothetical protein
VVAFVNEPLLIPQPAGFQGLFALPESRKIHTMTELKQGIEQIFYTGCSKMTECKAHEGMRNEAYFSVRCSDE